MAQSTEGTFSVVIRAKEASEAFERFSGSGAAHPQGMAGCPSDGACSAKQRVQVPPPGLFADPAVIRNVTQGGGCDP